MMVSLHLPHVLPAKNPDTPDPGGALLPRREPWQESWERNLISPRRQEELPRRRARARREGGCAPAKSPQGPGDAAEQDAGSGGAGVGARRHGAVPDEGPSRGPACRKPAPSAVRGLPASCPENTSPELRRQSRTTPAPAAEAEAGRSARPARPGCRAPLAAPHRRRGAAPAACFPRAGRAFLTS